MKRHPLLIGAIAVVSTIALLTTTQANAQQAGTTRQSLNRTQSAIRSIQGNRSAPTRNSQAFNGAANQSLNRTQSRLNSIQRNQAIRLRGMQQQAIFGVPDRALGVHNNMRFRTQARLQSTYDATLRLQRPVDPRAQLHPRVIPIDVMRRQQIRRMQAFRQQQEAERLAIQGAEIQRRQNRQRPNPDPNGPVIDPRISRQGRFPGSDMLLRRPPVGIQPERGR